MITASVQRLIATSFLFVLASTAWAQNKRIGTFQFEVKQGSHTARLLLRTIPFDPTKHKVTTGDQTIIDGRPALGTDGNVPSLEIASIRLYIDGNEIRVPRHLYSDCYEPNLVAPFFTVNFKRNARTVMVEMKGSDAAGSYTVRWQLSKNGRHKRLAYQHFSAEDSNSERVTRGYDATAESSHESSTGASIISPGLPPSPKYCRPAEIVSKYSEIRSRISSTECE